MKTTPNTFSHIIRKWTDRNVGDHLLVRQSTSYQTQNGTRQYVKMIGQNLTQQQVYHLKYFLRRKGFNDVHVNSNLPSNTGFSVAITE